MKRKEAEQVYKLLEELTKAEICSRLKPTSRPEEAGEYFQVKLDKMDEIRRLLYGTDNQVVLGLRWGILKPKKKKKKKKKKKVKEYRGFADV